jgi:hypothetical protein
MTNNRKYSTPTALGVLGQYSFYRHLTPNGVGGDCDCFFPVRPPSSGAGRYRHSAPEYSNTNGNPVDLQSRALCQEIVC